MCVCVCVCVCVCICVCVCVCENVNFGGVCARGPCIYLHARQQVPLAIQVCVVVSLVVRVTSVERSIFPLFDDFTEGL